MAPLMPPEAFACGHDHGTAQAQAFRRMHEPLGQQLVIEATTWLHKKGNLVAFHERASKTWFVDTLPALGPEGLPCWRGRDVNQPCAVLS